jgi:hypothetical protein
LADDGAEECAVAGTSFFVDAAGDGETLAFFTARLTISDPWPLESAAMGFDDNKGVEGIEATGELDDEPSNAMAIVPGERWRNCVRPWYTSLGNKRDWRGWPGCQQSEGHAVYRRSTIGCHAFRSVMKNAHGAKGS